MKATCLLLFFNGLFNAVFPDFLLFGAYYPFNVLFFVRVGKGLENLLRFVFASRACCKSSGTATILGSVSISITTFTLSPTLFPLTSRISFFTTIQCPSPIFAIDPL